MGSWSAWSFQPNSAATKAFEDSLGKLYGAKYKLVAAASQLVNGTNYAFLCEAEAETYPSTDYVVVAHVYQPIKGPSHITGIESIGPKPHHVMGGFGNWEFEVNKKAKSVFEAAVKHLMGVNYKPLAVTQQLVAGTNYVFLADATPVIERPFSYPALVSIYQPLQGGPVIERIQQIPAAAQHATEALSA